MELSQLKEQMEHLDRQVAENTQINRRLLSSVLAREARSHKLVFRWLSAIPSIAGVILVFAVFIPRFNAPFVSPYGLALGALIVSTGISVYGFVREMWLMGRLDFSLPVRELAKIFIRLEKTRMIIHNLNLIYGAVVVLAIILFVSRKSGSADAFRQDLLWPLIIVGLGGLIFYFYRIKILRQQLRKLNEKLCEIAAL